MPDFHPLFGALGAAVLGFLALDVSWTTLHRGGGPLTRLMIGPLWRWAQRAHQRRSGGHALLGMTGLFLVLFTVFLWVTLVWAGWTLVFLSAERAVVGTETGEPADLGERIYFAGFTVFTLGLGDFRPGPSFGWQGLTGVASLSGFALVTFAVAYLTPVTQCVVRKRAFATRVAALGGGSFELFARATGRGDHPWGLEHRIEDALDDLAFLLQAHHAYPVLHFFHDAYVSESVAVTLARLDEAYRLSRSAAPPTTPRPGLTSQWDALVDRFLASFVRSTEGVEVPPLPAASRIGFPEPDWELFEAHAARRRRLRALVFTHGWRWDHVTGDFALTQSDEKEAPSSDDDEEEPARGEATD